MSTTIKKPLLDLPLKVVLTEEGASYFIGNKKKLLRFRLADNAEEYGIMLNNFAPLSLQRMILVDYVSKVEISMPEFVSKRQEIMDLSKLIVYSLLYKQFNSQIQTVLLSTDCIKKHNRANPSQLFDNKTKMSENVLHSALAGKSAIISETRKYILEPINKDIIHNKDYSPEEKNMYILMAEKFLNRLSLFNWYIIVLFLKNPGFSEMVTGIRDLLKVYLEKSKVAEYSSLMIMELAQMSENANMRKESKKMYPDVHDNDMVLYDPEIRQKIIKELTRNHELVFLSWKIGGGATAIGKQGRLEITLYNKDDEFQEFKENLDQKKSADLNKKTLIDFYRDVTEGETGNNDLGLYYISYLDDACRDMNIKFDSTVNQFSSSDLTVITLFFNF
jgi:hypothetical protein